MRISTRGRYGLRAMLELARHFGEDPVLTSTVAKEQRLSRKYLHALLTLLRSAGLVRSTRGISGGFVLTRPPAEIRLSEILLALEGPLSLVDCVADKRACGEANRCAARLVWQELSGAIEEALSARTLEDMVALDREECSGVVKKFKTCMPRAKGRSSGLPRATSRPPRGRAVQR